MGFMARKSVGMIIEGSYPYIVGGVASWCQSLIDNLPEIDFKIIAILPEQYKEREIQYKLPDNIIEFKKIWLGSFGDEYTKKKFTFNRKRHKEVVDRFFCCVKSFFNFLKFNNYRTLYELVSFLYPADSSLIDFSDIFTSRNFFNLIKEYYELYFSSVPFIQFFWTIHNIFQPLYKLGTYSIPYADCYHTISTGYAGLVGVLAKLRFNRPLLLTEHGIYVNERRDEIDASDKIRDDLKPVWKIFFKHLCSLTYPFCDRVITLYRNNSLSEIEECCLPGNIEIIPNGINLNLFGNLTLEKRDIVNVGIVARVVPIKDVITFIKASRYVKDKNVNIKFFIIGPTDEDVEYYEKCKALVDELNLQDTVTFTGKVNMKDFYPKIDIMVLTSVREAQPLTLMEAMAIGIPCVSSNVGSCSELLEGVGFITAVKAPEKTAEAILRLAENKDLWLNLSKKSKIRATVNYDWNKIVDEYRRIYKRYSSWQA